jgi:TolA-binding protein
MNIDERKLDEALPIPWSQLRIILGVMLTAALLILLYIFNTAQEQAAQQSLRNLYQKTPTTQERQALLAQSKPTPTAALLWLQLARQYHDEKQFENAIAAYSEFLTRFPQHPLKPAAQYGKAITLLNIDKKQEALDTLLEISTSRIESPYTPQALLQAARIHLALGSTAEARRLLRENLELYPQNQTALQAQFLLNEIPQETQPNSPPPPPSSTTSPQPNPITPTQISPQ